MRRPLTLIVIAAAAGLAAGAAFADANHAFVGAEKCKMCHNSAAKGAQFSKWLESKHSKAFASLGTPTAKTLAEGRGVKTDPQKAPECLKCHTAGFGVPADRLTEKYKAEDGVSCEGCHGPGGDYWKMDVMKDRAKAEAAGMVLPKEANCVKCHNQESPTFRGFKFEEAMAKVAHPNPQRAAGGK